MPSYVFRCTNDGEFEMVLKMEEVTRPQACPLCGLRAERVFLPIPDVWHTEGSHKGDYGSGNHTGTKADALNRNWSKAWGEKPPPPATDVPRNGSEKY